MRKPNRRKFTREQCSRGGSRTRGYETEEERRQKALIDAKGAVLRHGMSYRADKPQGVEWCKRRALFGRVDQIEIVLGGKVVKTCGETQLKGPWADFRGQ